MHTRHTREDSRAGGAPVMHQKPLPVVHAARCEQCGDDWRVGWWKGRYETDEPKHLCEMCVGAIIGFVYEARAGDIIKIGWSIDPWHRLEQLKRQSGLDLELTFWAPAERGVEYAYHKLLAPYCIKGREWYRACDEITALFDFRSYGQLVVLELTDVQTAEGDALTPPSSTPKPPPPHKEKGSSA